MIVLEFLRIIKRGVERASRSACVSLYVLLVVFTIHNKLHRHMLRDKRLRKFFLSLVLLFWMCGAVCQSISLFRRCFLFCLFRLEYNRSAEIMLDEENMCT